MKKLNKYTILILIVIFSACTDTNNGAGRGLDLPDVDQVVHIDLSNYDDVIEEEASASLHTDPCIECAWYFCPPLDSVWQKQMCFNRCEDPPTLIYESDCTEYLECDPSQYHLDFIDCTTVDGYPGIQEKVCEKGQIKYTDCATECTEELCNGIDDDCDDAIDEGQKNACGACGPVPEEICDAVDNDCNGSTDEDLHQPCYTACGTGVEFCNDGNWVSCTAPPELMEICDGLDNDCDGQIDEDLTCTCTIQDVGVLFPCMDSPLKCGQGFKTCECLDPECTQITTTDCYAFCHYFPQPGEVCDPTIGMPLQQEKCNNFDDNCNEEIDEDLMALCYTGPPGTAEVGICLPGNVTCKEGTWGSYTEDGAFIPGMCADEVTPQDEICNGVDDDCDGITDAGEGLKDTDILFIVDWSGSMDADISAVLSSLNAFASKYSDENVIQWGLVVGPKVTPGFLGNHNYLELISNLAPFSDFMTAFAGMNGVGMFGQYEMLYDAIYLSIWNITTYVPLDLNMLSWPLNSGTSFDDSTPQIKDFFINWRPNAKRVVIVFTDEKGQSYMGSDPTKNLFSYGEVTQEILVDMAATSIDLKIYTFSSSIYKNYQNTGWAPIAEASGGKWYGLSSNATVMYNYLMEIIEENACSL